MQNVNKAIKYYQQGDVLLVLVESLPEGLSHVEADDTKGKVLQESETTGHHHHFEPGAPVDLYVGAPVSLEGVTTVTPNEGKYIVVGDTAVLYHGKEFDPKPYLKGTGDHEALTVPPGTYRIDIVREQDFSSEDVRRVVD